MRIKRKENSACMCVCLCVCVCVHTCMCGVCVSMHVYLWMYISILIKYKNYLILHYRKIGEFRQRNRKPNISCEDCFISLCRIHFFLLVPQIVHCGTNCVFIITIIVKWPSRHKQNAKDVSYIHIDCGVLL